MNWRGKRTLVVGGGRSGQAAARKLLSLGAEVYLADPKPAEQLAGIQELSLDASHLLVGRPVTWTEANAELVVLSPGVPPQQPLIQDAMRAGVPVWSEVELAMHDCPAVCVGVTGTNGKTTTTTLIGELAKRTGQLTVVAGNIGLAMSGEVGALGPDGIVVAEFSSFQLEFIDKLRVQIAILLNVTPDHLDRHGTVENYLAAKARIFENQGPDDLAILNYDDQLVKALGDKLSGRVIYFSPTSFLADGISLRGDQIVFAQAGRVTEILARQEVQLRGTHNLENVMAAMAAAWDLGLTWSEIAQGLREFKGVAHRQEQVGTFEGILFINDSKGTNTDAAEKALKAFNEPLVLIAGGKNKGLDFHSFMELVKQKVKSLVLVGKAAEEMEQVALEVGVSRIVRAGDFPDAVEKAIGEAVPGDVVLLSPACTSWDMFTSYEERGELFKELVRRHYQ